MTDNKTLWRERLESPLTWHYVGFSILLLVVIVLATRFALDWSSVSTGSKIAMANKQIELRALQLQTAPLRGLDKRVAETHDEIQGFYDKRIPQDYSQIAEQIGALQVKSGVRLSRLQYAQGLTDQGLTEISMDAGITGEYPQVMHFINALERDKTFFLIRAMGLTGQQGGVVNLRLRVSTWLRPENVPSGLARTSEADKASGQESNRE